ncbi:MAG: cysteine--tRNA ligase, partial [Pyrinomonadaceae bacterium]|nr:cysteine--tRNA ligase [Pyrinomonadaceae bacterium]
RLQQFRRLVGEAKTDSGSYDDVKALVKRSLQEFETSLDEDLNTSRALAAIHNLVREVNTVLTEKRLKEDDQSAILDAIETFNSVLGVFGEEQSEILDEEIEKLIEERQKARNDRDFKRSDEIRDELAEKGIILEDTNAGVRWKRR